MENRRKMLVMNRRGSTLLAESSNLRRKSLSLGVIPHQDTNFLCVPELRDPTVRLVKSAEYVYFDTISSLKKIESCTLLQVPTDFKFAEVEIQLYKERWPLLTLCVIYTALSFMQWIQFSIITNIIMEYYDVSSVAVDWTSMVFMVTYIVFVFPLTCVIDMRTLRETAIVGTVGTAMGSWIKTFALNRSGFPILIFGQIIVAISQIFILNVPQKIATAWFSLEEMSTVCGIGVFGAQLGVSLGFLTTPWLMKYHESDAQIHEGLQMLCFINAGLTTVITCVVLTVYKSSPENPPSHVQAIMRSGTLSNRKFFSSYWKSIKRLLHDHNFLKIIITHGINTGALNALSTLLNQIILTYFPDSEQDAGNVGVTIIITGLFGSLIFGFIMDTMNKYKATAVWISGLSAIGMLLFFLALESSSKILLYVSSIILGFFLTGYQTVASELASELTFPKPEGPVIGILNISTHAFGVILTIMLSQIEDYLGTTVEHLILVILLIIGTIIGSRIDSNLKRTSAHEEVATTIEELAKIELEGSNMIVTIEEC